MEHQIFTKVQSAAFTGHRFLPFGSQEYLKEQIRNVIIECYSEGIHNYFCGMAIGFDMLAAEAVLEMKTQLHDIALSAVVPYRNQNERFSPSAQRRYTTILNKADNVIVLNEEYHTRCFFERNDYMVDRASLLIAYFDGTHKGGTFYTCSKAKSKGMPINNLYTL